MAETPFPPAAFSFQLQIPGEDAAAFFQELSGLETELEVKADAEGGVSSFVHRLPGPIKHANLVLKRGMIASPSPLLDWVKQSLEGGLSAAISVRTLDLTLVDTASAALAAWRFEAAWPVQWDIADFDKGDGTLLIEKLEFAYNKVVR